MISHFSTGDLTFPLLAEPGRYVACAWELAAGSRRLEYWLGLFRGHFPKLLAEAGLEEADRGVDPADTRRRTAAALAAFNAYLDRLAASPGGSGRLDILKICVERELILRRGGIVDPYRLPKTRENAVALACLPRLLEELDALGGEERLELVTRGIFAGNIFDLGATQTADLFKNKSVDFHAVRLKLAPRPWRVDDGDAWLGRLAGRRHRCAVLFVDNAGADVVLGMLPLARELLVRGTGVILAANATPTLNDVTLAELRPIVQGIAAWDPVLGDALKDGRLELVSSGNGLPLIDLTRVSAELVESVRRRGVDLVVIEGMGRAIESNFDAKLTCDTLKIAMVKDRGVADELGGKVYDLVLRFEAV